MNVATSDEQEGYVAEGYVAEGYWPRRSQMRMEAMLPMALPRASFFSCCQEASKIAVTINHDHDGNADQE